MGTTAFLGLGRMGLPMSLNAARAGHEVRAWNRTRRDIPDPPPQWTQVASAAEAVADADIVVTVLPDLAQVREVCDPVLRPGQLVLVMGTVSPVGVRDWAAELDARQIAVLDAPVSGGDVGARDANLSIMIGGDAVDVDRARSLFNAMGTTIVHFGPVGAGQLAKACNQIVVATTLSALGEAVALGARGGLDVPALLDILAGGLAGSRALDMKRAKFESHDFTPGGSAEFQHKDLGFALEAARASGVVLPVTAVVDQLFAAMRARGHGQDDHSGVVQIIELLSGV